MTGTTAQPVEEENKTNEPEPTEQAWVFGGQKKEGEGKVAK